MFNRYPALSCIKVDVESVFKIIKETYETYNIGEDGVKSYSDSYVRDVMYTYYFFDANGVITDVYFIDIMDTGYILRKNHRIFNCTQSEYEIIETGEKLNQKINNVYKAKITKDNDKLILNFDKRYNLAEKIVFSKNRITKSYISGERMKSDNIFDYQINDNRIYYKDFTVENGIEDALTMDDMDTRTTDNFTNADLYSSNASIGTYITSGTSEYVSV